MQDNLKNQALSEILKSHDLIVVSKDKNLTKKIGKELGETLCALGINPKEAKVLLEIAGEKIADRDSDDDGISLLTYSDETKEYVEDEEDE